MGDACCYVALLLLFAKELTDAFMVSSLPSSIFQSMNGIGIEAIAKRCALNELSINDLCGVSTISMLISHLQSVQTLRLTHYSDHHIIRAVNDAMLGLIPQHMHQLQ